MTTHQNLEELLKEYDPYPLMETLHKILDNSQKITTHIMTNPPQGNVTMIDHDPLNMSQSFQELWGQMLMQPGKVMEAQTAYWQHFYKVWQNVTLRALGQEIEPQFSPAKGDRRFKHEAWENVPTYDFIKQSYLLSACWLHNLVKLMELEKTDPRQARKVDFYTRQLIDALSPSNFIFTNPEVLYTTLQTSGVNLLKGYSNFLEDLERGKGQLSIKMTDLEAFKPGENIAVTPGKVVFQNDLIQLLQYTPTTEQVYKKPLMIVPPWINKYYILDLSPKNSFIKYAVEQGHTVFVLSWVNPDGKLADKDFANYMLEGPLAALDAIEQATGEKEINAIGYCLGGTLLASTLAYMAEKGDNRITSATFFTTLLDFSDPGELGIFIDEEQIVALEEQMAEKGYLDGSSMATTFTMLRANDLIWSFHINNYLLGNEASAFDLLYWNSDSTRMPAKMHSFYLRNMYQNNLLKNPGGVTLDGVAIDLSKVEVPAYFISTQEDHIAPWLATYEGTQLLSGSVKFVLGGSGHIAGVINPPAKNKYFYYTNSRTKSTKNPDTWLKNAKQNLGSWWPDWAEWVGKHAGEQVPARTPGAGQLSVLEDAPGSYVKVSVLG